MSLAEKIKVSNLNKLKDSTQKSDIRSSDLRRAEPKKSTGPTCFHWLAPGGLTVKGEGAGTPPGLGTRDSGGLGAAAGV